MTSIYQRVLGTDFTRLHPRIQERFGFCSADGTAAIGTGTMEEVWHGPFWTMPFLQCGAWRNILVPKRGREVPFTIENYAYVDGFGRETVTWIRTFSLERKHRFDATMIHSRQRDMIVDYLGTHQHLAVDIAMSIDDNGGLRLRSGEQRFYIGNVGFRFPRLFTGIADVHEWYDDEQSCFRISVKVVNRTWGPLFGYHGSFQNRFIPCSAETVPPHVKPLHERRGE